MHTETDTETLRLPMLDGIKILDFSTVLAAPFAATLCADLGANVTKIELPDGSDALRGLAPTTSEHALYWKVVNRNKQGITLDVRKPEGCELFLKAIARTDVLVENFRTGTLDKWGLDLKTLHAVNPNLVVLRITGFGQTGPYAKRPGFARIFEAMSGLTNLIGTPESGPQHPNLPIGDLITGVFGAFSIASAMASLRARPEQGGFEIDLSATEAIFRLLDPLAVEQEVLGYTRSHVGNRADYTAPSNMYRSKDHIWVTLVASSNPIFSRLCHAIGRVEWLSDSRFETNPGRCKNVEVIDEGISQWFAGHDFSEIEQVLGQADVPYTKVFNIKDVLADPQVQSRQSVMRIEDPDLGSIPAPCVVPRVAVLGERKHRSGPSVGEHNAIFYAELGLSEDEIAQLKIRGVL